MPDLERFTVSMDRRLLEQFDERNERHGYANRSEAIRDLIRRGMVDERWEDPPARGKLAATVTLIFDHHKRDTAKRLTEEQHHHSEAVVASTHVHLDNDNCLEVVILRGEAGEVRSLAERLVAAKGVKHGGVVYTTEGKDLP